MSIRYSDEVRAWQRQALELHVNESDEIAPSCAPYGTVPEGTNALLPRSLGCSRSSGSSPRLRFGDAQASLPDACPPCHAPRAQFRFPNRPRGRPPFRQLRADQLPAARPAFATARASQIRPPSPASRVFYTHDRGSRFQCAESARPRRACKLAPSDSAGPEVCAGLGLPPGTDETEQRACWRR
jgi:hypothetical protein